MLVEDGMRSRGKRYMEKGGCLGLKHKRLELGEYVAYFAQHGR